MIAIISITHGMQVLQAISVPTGILSSIIRSCNRYLDVIMLTFLCYSITSNGPILSNSLQALNKLWHPHHLLCARCNKPIDPDVGHVEKNNKVYCPHDFTDLFLPKCRACNRPVEKAVSSSDGKLEGKWHASCFCCQVNYRTIINCFQVSYKLSRTNYSSAYYSDLS